MPPHQSRSVKRDYLEIWSLALDLKLVAGMAAAHVIPERPHTFGAFGQLAALFFCGVSKIED
jgi:hypothetical protein